MDWIKWAAMVSTCVLALVLLSKWSGRIKLRQQFDKDYGFDLPLGFTMRRMTGSDKLGFELSFPHWLHAKRDGTRHRVHKDNRVIYTESWMCDGSRVILSKDPHAMYDLVVELREAGFEVPHCSLESSVVRAASTRGHGMRKAALAQSAENLHKSFSGDHRAFEYWCADLLSRDGWDAEVTQGGADGGVDVMLRDGVRTGIVECKLYAPSAGVGRPVLQKLMGAQATHRASEVMIMTTSYFTATAIAYAKAHNVVLFDGGDLVEKARRVDLGETLAGEARLLSPRDIWQNFPADLVA